MDVDQNHLQQQLLQPTSSFVFDTGSRNGDLESNSSGKDSVSLMTTASSISMATDILPQTPVLAIQTSIVDQTEPTTCMATPQAMWTTPTTQSMRPRPATIHESFSYGMGEAYEGLSSWDPSALALQQTPSDTMSRPISMHQDFYPATTMDNTGAWIQKPCDDSLDLQLDSDMSIGQAYTTDEAIPILDLRYSNGTSMEGDALNFDGGLNPRRFSGSSFTMSTSGALSDMPSYEDFSAALSDAPSFSSDYPPPSNRNSLMSSTQLSPVASPRMTPQSRSELVRTQSRGRASPSPRPGLRSAPYSVDGPRSKRWSTGSYATQSNRRPSSFGGYHANHANLAVTSAPATAQEAFGAHLTTSTPAHQPSPTAMGQLPLNTSNLQQANMAAAAATQVTQPQAQFFLPSNTQAAAVAAVAAASGFGRHSMLLPTQLPSQTDTMAGFHHPHQMDGGFTGSRHLATHQLQPRQIPTHIAHAMVGQPQHHHLGMPFETPAPLLPHGLFRMLQSNGDPHTLHGHYTDLSDPPDLYASLHEEQLPPPPEDMDPSDPDLVPHEQELRFSGDLYTPKWVRGHGNKREGWCGICKPGRWLVLKNSAFWYDKSFTHGISAATGNPFQEPQDTRRMDGNPDVWEGLCGSCNDWIALVSSKKKGTTWFRHAYKCHTHPKIKDAPKRRRESSHARLSTTVNTGIIGALNGTSGNSISSMANMVKSVSQSVSMQQHQPQPQQLQQQQQKPLPPATSAMTALPPPTPLTPMASVAVPPMASVETTSVNNEAGANMSQMQIEMPVPVPVSMSMAGKPATSATFEAKVEPQQSPKVFPKQEYEDKPNQTELVQKQPNALEHLQQLQHQQQHVAQMQQFTQLPPQLPPPTHPPPAPPQQSHHRFQHHIAHMGVFQSHQHQQRALHHSRPPPPAPVQTRILMAPVPMAPVECLGNMI